MRILAPFAAAAALVLTPAVAFAQADTVDATAVPATTTEDDEFPWGLLGLLGLAGLAGLKRRDDRHVDARRPA